MMNHIEMEYKLRKVTRLYMNSLSKCGNRSCIQQETTAGRRFGVCHQCQSVKYCCQDYLIQHWAKHKLWCDPIANENVENIRAGVANPIDGLERPQVDYEEVN